MKHIIFDFDGTLVDSKEEILDTYKRLCEKLPPPEKLDLDTISLTGTMQATLEIIYKNNVSDIEKAKKIYAELYDNSTFEKTLLYPHVFETLKQLYEAKYTLHIATNKRLVPTLNILNRKRLSGFFSSVKASDQIAGKTTSKEYMVREICIENNLKSGFMVGDSQKDIEAGKVFGLATVAVTYGYEKQEDLMKKNPTFVIHLISELLEIVNKP